MKTAEQSDVLDAPDAAAMDVSQRDPRPKFSGEYDGTTGEDPQTIPRATPEQIAAAIKAEGARLRMLDQALFISTVKYLMAAVPSADRDHINASLRPLGLAQGDFVVPDDLSTSTSGEEWDAYTS